MTEAQLTEAHLTEARLAEARLTEIEIALAHQQRLLDELSDVVRAQADALDLLRAQARVLATRLAAAESALPDDAPDPDQPPPHW